MIRIGSTFSGYGGLDMAVAAVTGGTVAWHCEIEKAPSRILAHHWPDVPNHGDITAVDWQAVEPVDVLTGGFPCQDLSHAGKRAGLRPDTRSGLWSHMAYAIDQLRPSLVVAENVRGLLSAEAHSDVEPCPWCVGDNTDGALRALGAVLGDLSDIGYDAAWVGLRAADVGAPHGRFRVFVVAYPTGDTGRFQHGDSAADEYPTGRGADAAQLAGRRRGTESSGALLPTPTSSDTNGAGAHGDGGLDLRTAVSLMPTPRATDGVKGGPNQRGSSGDLMLPSAVALLPTPRVTTGGSIASQTRVQEVLDGKALETADCRLELTVEVQARRGDWGIYADAIARWEALTRPAPAPTQQSAKGNPQLSAAFSEWLMGLPAGHVTGVPGLSRNEQLKALGNGVVPAQAAAALDYLLGVIDQERAA